MIELHHCVSARSFRPLWALEELGLPYELKMLAFPPRVHAREFMELNPAGTIPAMRDEQTWMTESVAICQYLAARHPAARLAVEAHEPDFGAYLDWSIFGEATLTFPQTIVLRYSRFEAEQRKLPQAVEDYSRWFLARLRLVESALEARAYLAAGRFTVADISVGYALMLAGYLGLAQQFKPKVAAYWEALQEREGFKRAISAQHQAALAQGVPVTPAPLV
ncbi:MAG: glutathione S-transferase family protein [Quisquiliibacterium sp.]